jgi:hypothetical protein
MVVPQTDPALHAPPEHGAPAEPGTPVLSTHQLSVPNVMHTAAPAQAPPLAGQQTSPGPPHGVQPALIHTPAPHAPEQHGWLIVPQVAHWPLLHASPGMHAVEQVPQWFGSLAVFTHPTLAPQLVNPTAHAQTPEMHEAPEGHCVLHEPQCNTSLVSFTHVPPHTTSPLGHWHAPLMHDAPAGHTLVHVPQWLGSDVRSAQLFAAHNTCGLEHVHAPTTHENPGRHCPVHDPQ